MFQLAGLCVLPFHSQDVTEVQVRQRVLINTGRVRLHVVAVLRLLELALVQQQTGHVGVIIQLPVSRLGTEALQLT